jgi:hypothetical protein
MARVRRARRLDTLLMARAYFHARSAAFIAYLLAHDLWDELKHWRLVRLPDHPRSTR